MILDASKGDRAVVLLDGKDVSDRCTYVDTEAGEIIMEATPRKIEDGQVARDASFIRPSRIEIRGEVAACGSREGGEA